MLQTLTDFKTHRGFSVSFTISALKSDEEYALSDVFCIPSIPVTPNLIPAKTDLDKSTYLRDIEFPQVKNATVTLLIGADCPEMFCVSEMRKGARGQPVAIKTPLGWSLLGPSLSLGVSKNCQVNFVKATDTSCRDISCLWENDFGCDTSVLDIPSSNEDRIVYESMQKSVTIVDGHYQLPLPWRDHVSYPGDSLPMAQRRLLSLQKRLQRDKKLHYQYSEVIETFVKNYYARAIPNEELDVNSITWTLPHFPVYHPKKDKVRIAFDCAAKFMGFSLNDMLMQGPDLVCNLVGVLLRFRRERIALTADIECMFHQIEFLPKTVTL